MSSNRLVFSGLDELRAALRALPADLTGEASHVVEGAANGATADIKAIYGAHAVTGHLRDSTVVAQRATGPYGVVFQVKVTDPIAWLFDNGSQARHKVSGASTGTMWGQTPPTHAFIGTMIRARLAMYAALKDLLVTHGLVVSGEA